MVPIPYRSTPAFCSSLGDRIVSDRIVRVPFRFRRSGEWGLGTGGSKHKHLTRSAIALFAHFDFVKRRVRNWTERRLAVRRNLFVLSFLVVLFVPCPEFPSSESISNQNKIRVFFSSAFCCLRFAYEEISVLPKAICDFLFRLFVF